MTDLATHLANLNAEKLAWLEEGKALGESRWTGLYTEDLDHWAEYGVTTVEEFELHEMKQCYSDMHKDAYGFRPRVDTSDWTAQDWKDELDRVGKDLDRAIEEEKRGQELAIESTEAMIAGVAEYAGDRETALRWLTAAENFRNEQDVEHWVWETGTLFTDYGRNLVKEIKTVCAV